VATVTTAVDAVPAEADEVAARLPVGSQKIPRLLDIKKLGIKPSFLFEWLHYYLQIN